DTDTQHRSDVHARKGPCSNPDQDLTRSTISASSRPELTPNTVRLVTANGLETAVGEHFFDNVDVLPTATVGGNVTRTDPGNTETIVASPSRNVLPRPNSRPTILRSAPRRIPVRLISSRLVNNPRHEVGTPGFTVECVKTVTSPGNADGVFLAGNSDHFRSVPTGIGGLVNLAEPLNSPRLSSPDVICPNTAVSTRSLPSNRMLLPCLLRRATSYPKASHLFRHLPQYLRIDQRQYCVESVQ